MAHPYFAFLLLLTAGTAVAQAPADTARPRPPFRGLLPDSLAAAPTPGGTLLLNGQAQPARPFLTIQDQLRTVAGVQVTPYDGAPGSGQVVRIRGANTAQGLGQPLYVIDGLPALNDDLTPGQGWAVLGAFSIRQYRADNSFQANFAEQQAEIGANPLQLLPPESVASIEVLAGPAAVARYGALGANGVVSIRTRPATGGRAPHLRYSAYAGLQQLRQRYDLLDASQYAELANEASFRRFGNTVATPFPSTALGAGTDWQAETFRPALLHQHQLSFDGSLGATTYRLSADYRQQAGLLANSDLTRLGLRLALGRQLGTRLQLRGTLALGQTDQRLPYTQGDGSPTRGALFAPPNQPVRTANGTYTGYGPYSYSFAPSATLNFANPLAGAEYSYRDPRTRRLLAQLGATYTVLPHLTLEASANFQRTVLAATGYLGIVESRDNSLIAPGSATPFTTQSYRASQWAGQLALRYLRPLGQRHAVGAELDYQYQALDVWSNTGYGLPNSLFSGYGYYRTTGEMRLHRPWARLHYTLDSALTVEASLSYASYRGTLETQYYPAAQLSWRHALPAAELRLWAGASRTGTYGVGYGTSGPLRLISGFNTGMPFSEPRYQQPQYTNQAELGLRLASRSGQLSGQLVGYQRRTYHTLLNQSLSVPTGSNLQNTIVVYDEATISNLGLELTLTADWQRGRLQGSTRLVGSLNRNRLLVDNPTVFGPQFDNQPTASFYGFLQNGLNANGALQFVPASDGGYQRALLGTGIPPQLASLSQQLRLGRLALDVQLDGMFGYQMVNYQLSYLDTPSGYLNSATTALDRWTRTNTNTNIPVAGSPTNVLNIGGFVPQTNYLVENASHVRLSSLTLTYRLRQTATQDISVWAGGQNLFVLSSYRGYDPNISSGGAAPTLAGLDYGATPVPRTWLLGVSAGF
ncbi:TonB-dependent receptor plug domain-containing protein [Hymenobacter sp. ASUV-10]|uniref:TonB-dependent receptor plug domain-containing protein n=1 Tax=Hymenobacter aranciens TaxID=3063996 RepID=A0ABT9BC33_9BACT|nr:TonB-dependent receptor plug domain-containing protein [Hymenobacter sp. ASUV-10]MDO7875198.1 TonB-dependent receptor plug domain-containing protein [Hymenobacter sp. ASUV-10]